MTWTNPTNVTSGNAISSSDHNAQVIGNLAHLGGFKIADVAFSALTTGVSAARIAVGFYLGNATDNHAITGLGFQPKALFIKRGDATSSVVYARWGITGDASWNMSGSSVPEANFIQSLDADGFTVGSGTTHINANGVTYWYLAIG